MIVYNGNIVVNNGRWINPPPPEPDPYNPLNLPPNTVRVRTSDGNVPKAGAYAIATLVPGTSDVYDVYKSGTDLNQLLSNSKNVIEVLGANTSNVTNMSWMFTQCTSLTNVPLFDTSKVTTMHQMFYGCSNLTTVPLFDTSNVTSMRSTFAWCTNVQSGALALYQQASTQTNPPTYHDEAFLYCGKNTQTGSAELAQIPHDWKY